MSSNKNNQKSIQILLNLEEFNAIANIAKQQQRTPSKQAKVWILQALQVRGLNAKKEKDFNCDEY